jgi:formylglycine-generating enzyme required for sulfatase activity
MSGNVSEWTTGYIDYNGTTTANPYPIPARVYSDVRLRGGNFTNNAVACRVSARVGGVSITSFNFAFGFRVCH